MRRRVAEKLFMTLLGGAVAAGLLGACALVIGLDERGARPDDAGTGEETGVADAGPDVETYCDRARADGAIFCDDFDEPGQDPNARWLGIDNVLPSPLIYDGGSFAIVPGADPPRDSPPAVLAVALENRTLDSPSGAVLFQGFDAVPPGTGVVFSFEIQLREFDVEGVPLRPPKDAGPAPEVLNEHRFAATSLVGIAPRYGAGIGVSDRHLSLYEDYEGLSGEHYAKVARISLLIIPTWVRVYLATGPRDKIASYVYERRLVRADAGPGDICPDVPYVVAAWASSPPEEWGCIGSDPSVNPIAAEQPFGFALGALVRDPMVAKVRYDSVRVDLLP